MTHFFASDSWARLTFLVLYRVTLPFTLCSFVPDFGGPSLLSALTGAVEAILEGTALILIFSHPGKAWFTKPRTGSPLRQPPPEPAGIAHHSLCYS